MWKKADKRNRGRGGSHGLYSLIPKVSQIDGRTRFGKAVAALRKSLFMDLGENLSMQQRILVDHVIFKVLRLGTYESVTLQQDDVSPGAEKNYLALANSVRLDLVALGLEKRERDITDLKSYLAGKEEGSVGS